MSQIIAGDAVGGVIYDMSRLTKGFDEIGRRVAIVFDDENSHDAALYLSSPIRHRQDLRQCSIFGAAMNLERRAWGKGPPLQAEH